MTKVEFNYIRNATSILWAENESMEEICKKFASKIQVNINNLIFLYSGINNNLKFQIISNYEYCG